MFLYSEENFLKFPDHSVNEKKFSGNTLKELKKAEKLEKAFRRENNFQYEMKVYDTFDSFLENYSTEAFSHEFEKYITENKNANLRGYLSTYDSKIFIKSYYSDHEKSLVKVYSNNNEIIGQYWILYSVENNFYPKDTMFRGVFTINDKICVISYSYFDLDFTLAKKMDSLFKLSGDIYFYKVPTDVYLDFLLSKNEIVPDELIQFISDWDDIIQQIINKNDP